MRKIGFMLLAVAFIFSAFKFSNFDPKIEEGGIAFQNVLSDTSEIIYKKNREKLIPRFIVLFSIKYNLLIERMV